MDLDTDAVPPKDPNRLVSVQLDDALASHLSPETAEERDVAIKALLEQNSFALVLQEAPVGPFRLRLSVTGSRLALNVGDESGKVSQTVYLPLSTFRRILRDYRIICQSYHDALKSSALQRIEAIDMGRRGLHDEGARVLREALEGKILVDFPTARRLFTLIHVLQWQSFPAPGL